MRRLVKPLSWVVGLAGVIAVIWYFDPANIPRMLENTGWSGAVSWAAITILARIFLAETTIAPLSVLGYSMRRGDAFWIGWLRTFANQVFPAAGIVAYTQAIRHRVGISWSEMVSSIITPRK